MNLRGHHLANISQNTDAFVISIQSVQNYKQLPNTYVRKPKKNDYITIRPQRVAPWINPIYIYLELPLPVYFPTFPFSHLARYFT